jgi:hypothetical protein
MATGSFRCRGIRRSESSRLDRFGRNAGVAPGPAAAALAAAREGLNLATSCEGMKKFFYLGEALVMS